MLFDKVKSALSGGLAKVAGNTDFLEAVCASAALVAAADGEIKDDEIKSTTAVVSSNPSLSKAFTPATIERTIDAMLKRAQAGRTGRLGLYKEIEQVSANAELSELVFVAALDVAEADGGVGDKEQQVLREVAKKLGVNPSNYLNV